MPSIRRQSTSRQGRQIAPMLLLADKGTYIPTTIPLAANPAADGLKVLIAACLRSDRTAQRRFYDAYSNLVWSVVRRYTEVLDIAEDIQSEAFCRIFARLGQYRFEGAFEGWVRRITVHAVADYFRRHRSTDATLNESAEEQLVSHNANALSGLSYKEILALIHELPNTQRAVFNLAVFDQYPHKEIAAMLGITENNSRWHLNDARRRLKEKLTAGNR